MMMQLCRARLLAGLLASGNALGAVDLSGVWLVAQSTQELKTVEDKAPPLKPEAAKLYEEHKCKLRAGDLSFDQTAKCVSPGLPRMFYLPYPFEIIQRPHKITYLFEWNYWNRHVYLNDRVQEVPYSLSLGLSPGKWQDDTLVITSTDLRADNTWLDSAGLPHSESLKIIEKLRLLDNGATLENRITFDDPETFTQPSTIRRPLLNLGKRWCASRSCLRTPRSRKTSAWIASRPVSRRSIGRESRTHNPRLGRTVLPGFSSRAGRTRPRPARLRAT